MKGDRENIIYNERDECIGYYADLVASLKHETKLLLDRDDFENAETICENLVELAELSEYDGLIVLSENNGMGFTARKYERS